MCASDENDLEDLVAQEYQEVQSQQIKLRDIVLDDDISRPLGKGTITYQDLNFNSLISMRMEHQTRQAATGIRTQYTQMVDATRKPETIRRQLIRRFHEILKEEQGDIAPGTGSERKARHIISAKGGQTKESSDCDTAGNALNAIAAATSAADKVRHLDSRFILGILIMHSFTFIYSLLWHERSSSPSTRCHT